MNELSIINASGRIKAIKTVLRNRPTLLERIIAEDGASLDPAATPDALDCDDMEETLVRIAWDIWNGSGETEFHKTLDQLPVDDFRAFIDALKQFEELRARIYGAYASGLEDD